MQAGALIWVPDASFPAEAKLRVPRLRRLLMAMDIAIVQAAALSQFPVKSPAPRLMLIAFTAGALA